MMKMPVLETERLLIRPFIEDDLEAIHRILDIELAESEFGYEETESLKKRARWLQWASLNYEQLADLHQPPYGDRVVMLKGGPASINWRVRFCVVL
jgi:ribosomal-protein-alanine N-acetyltransferase